MKKRQRVILLSSLLLASSLALTINYAFCSPFIRDNAGSINIGITGIALGDKDYYVFFGDDDKQALEKGEDGKYTTEITVDTAKDYSYKITDKFDNPKYQSDTFNLGITGTFNLSFDAPSDTSTTLDPSLTYSFSLVDEGNAFGASETALPYCFPSETEISSTRVNWWVIGQRSTTDTWWSVDAGGIRMLESTGNNGYAPHVYLPAGSQFKIYNGDTYKTYYGTNSFKGGTAKDDFTEYDTSYSSGPTYDGNNITVKDTAGGYYDIYFNSNCEIYINKSTTLKQADSFDTTTNTSTFTLDATQYASSSTHLSFFNKDSSKVTEDYSLSDLGATGSELTLKKYLYLDTSETLDSGKKWSSDSATFKAFTSDTEYIDMELYSGDVYRLKNPISTGVMGVNFKRWDPNDSSDTGIWNYTGNIVLGDNYVFKITGWTNSSVASSYSGAPEFVVEKVNTSTEGE